jgi:hypothetical protein
MKKIIIILTSVLFFGVSQAFCTTEKIDTTNYQNSILVNEPKEVELKMEDWMFDINYFKNCVCPEEDIKIEDWMKQDIQLSEKEQNLKLEKWMFEALPLK